MGVGWDIALVANGDHAIIGRYCRVLDIGDDNVTDNMIVIEYKIGQYHSQRPNITDDDVSVDHDQEGQGWMICLLVIGPWRPVTQPHTLPLNDDNVDLDVTNTHRKMSKKLMVEQQYLILCHLIFDILSYFIFVVTSIFWPVALKGHIGNQYLFLLSSHVKSSFRSIFNNKHKSATMTA